MSWKNKTDTPEEANIREQIKAAGLTGKISPAVVLKVPKEILEPLVREGKTNFQIARELGSVSHAPIGYLKKFYGLVNAPASKEPEWVGIRPLKPEKEPVTKKPDETLNVSVTYKTNEENLIMPETVRGTVTVEPKPAEPDPDILMHHTYRDEAVIVAETVMGLVRSLTLMKQRRVAVEVKVRKL